MRHFKTLLRLLLPDQIDWSFLKSWRRTLFKGGFAVLGFAAVTVVAYGIWWLAQWLNLFSPLNHLPLAVVAVVYAVIWFFSIISCTVGLSQALYAAPDNQLLITWPIPPNTLFLVKMVVYYGGELKRTVAFVVPIFWAYGFLSGFSWLYFPWVVVLLGGLAAVPVLIGGLLSLPLFYLTQLGQRWPALKIGAAGVVVTLAVTLVTLAIAQIPANLNLIKSWVRVSQVLRQFLAQFTQKGAVFYAIVVALCGRYENWHATLFTATTGRVLLGLVGVLGLLGVANYLISRPLYIKMLGANQTKPPRVRRRPQVNRRRPRCGAACWYESLRYCREPATVLTSLATLVVAPLAVLFLNRIYRAINTRLLGDYLTIGFNLVVILLFVLTHNLAVSAAYSRDGAALPLNLTRPQNAWQVLLPRLVYYGVVSTILLALCSGIFLAGTPLPLGSKILIGLTLWCVLGTHLLWSADFDFCHPQPGIYQTATATVNPNAIKSLVLAVVCSATIGALTVFLLTDGEPGVWWKLCGLAVGVFGWRWWLLTRKVRVLYREWA